ncbi:hypothetical protein NFI96_017951 [Prochilodus magdalenae]|nr:hypothetical protein NFI96_017951 [Prochilodus magdalenae]
MFYARNLIVCTSLHPDLVRSAGLGLLTAYKRHWLWGLMTVFFSPVNAALIGYRRLGEVNLSPRIQISFTLCVTDFDSGLCSAGPAGKEFALSFMQNYKQDNTGQSRFMVEVSSPPGTMSNTNVKVTALGQVFTTTLEPGAGEALKLPDGVEMIGSTISKQTVYVEADQDILVQSLNFKPFSADTSVIYPLKAWGTEYYIYTPQMGPSGTFKEFAITNQGIQNSVEIRLNGAVTFQGQKYPKGNKLTINLAPYETAQIQSTDDLTGSKVSANQPVAVFSGHSCTWQFSDCNHVYEQLLPVSSWGTEFAVASLAFTEPALRYDTVVIQASQDTQLTITQKGTPTAKQMVPGESLLISIPYPDSLHFTANKGVQVLYEFNGGSNKNGVMAGPFLITILSTDRFSTSYAIAAQDGFTNEAIIIARTADLGKLSLDTTPISKELQWIPIGKSDYSWTQLIYGKSTPGFHHIVHPNSPFALYSFGVSKQNGYGSLALANPPVAPAPKATCNIYGDPHYNTFDSVTYDFQGTCTYTAAQGCHLEGTKLNPFTVTVENEKWNEIQMSPNVSMAKVVVVEVYGMVLVLRRNELNQIMVNGILTNIPLSLNGGKVIIQQEGCQNVISTDFGLRVAYDMVYHVSITVPSSYRGRTCGLCGNYNGNRNDDFMLPGGKQTKDLKTFTAAWKVAVPGIVCDDGCTGDVCPQCPANKKAAFEKDCSIITNTQGPFAACHSVINPESYFRDCVYDTCMGNGDAKMFCHSIAAYMIDCQDFGVSVKNWRTPSFCPLSCPANTHYEICAQSCSASCPGLLGIISCDAQICAEGCMCDSGFVYNGTGCVKAQQCCCYENGYTYKVDPYRKETGKRKRRENHKIANVGESVIINECRERLTCLPTGQVRHESIECGADEVCEIRNGVRDCHLKYSKATCNIYGDPHYNTFDSVTYDFQGTCTYTAAEGCHLEGTKLNPFTVTVENEKWNEIQMSPNVSMAKVVVVEVYGMVLVLRRNELNQIMVNGILTNIPLSLNGGKVIIQQEGCQNVISTDFGLKVAYDMVYHVSITVPSSYRGRTCGLCGNYNGNRNDDFMLPGGKQTKDLKTFTAAWKVAVPGIVCDDGCTGDVCPQCPPNKKAAFEKDCSIITNPHGPFAACHSVINPESYFRDCVYDVCMGDGDAKMFCHSIAAYMIDCQDFGITVQNWRTPSFCPLSCPANSHYAVCARSCSAPCPGLLGIISCTGQVCAEGCMCDSGFIYNGTGCVQAQQCGCYENGQTYKIGQTVIVNGCHERLICLPTGQVKRESISCGTDEVCEIRNGVRGCYEKYSKATCNIYGDPHYNTFDSVTYDFQGTCTYTAAQGCHLEGTKLNPFTVTVENEKWNEIQMSPNVSMAKVVVVEVYGMVLVLRRNELNQIMVNGILTNIPLSLNGGKVIIRQEGCQNVILTDFGLRVAYDMIYHVSITVPSSYRGRTCGLCGNYNGNRNDDFMLPGGKQTKDLKTFTAAWKVAVPGIVCDNGCTGDVCPQCPANKKAAFEKDCSIITNPRGPFAACHRVINPESYFIDCVYDTCMGNGDAKMFCHSIAAYMIDCQDFGITVQNWRTPSFCPLSCPTNSHYAVCAQSCSAPCPGLLGIISCTGQVCAEGCMCDSGFVYNGTGCVKAQQCGCFENGHTYKIGQTVIVNGCHERLTCLPTGQVKRESISCGTDEVCEIRNGVRGCYEKYSKATCNIYGDPHYNTFDSVTYDFQGTCTYTAAEGCHLEGTKLNPFTVTVENEKWNEIQMSPNVSMAKVVIVEVYGMVLVLRRNELNQIMVNRILTNIPLSLNGGKVIIRQEGCQNVILTDFGLRVAYDMIYHVSITVPSSYRGRTCGLCGNYNGNRNDDFMLPGGKQTKDLKTFTAAWKVPVPGIVCDDGCTGDVCPGGCPPNKKAAFEKDCSIITNTQGPFAACHRVINPESYFRDCVYDVCMGDGDANMLCHSIAAYMIDCQDFGITVQNWRTPSFCPLKCPANSHYEVCARSCSAPCPGLLGIISCTGQVCAEGCMCDSGFIYNGTGCVQTQQCGCFENGHTYKIGQTVVVNGCHERLTCLPTGQVRHESISCRTDEVCEIRNGVRGCHPKTPTCPANSHFESCACPATCENPHPYAECKGNCVGACVCDAGYLWSENKCIPKNQCGCIYSIRGVKLYLQVGESIWADNTCNKKCTCDPTSGRIVCKKASCQSGSECRVVNGIRGCHAVTKATCNIYGDPHYNTFDSVTYDFQGTCTYTAAEGCHLEGTKLNPFTVTVENEKWNEIQMSPNVSMAKVVVVEVYGMVLVLRRNELNQIMVNGILTNIPLSLNGGKVIIQQEGCQNVISTDFGLKVAYDMVYHVSITVPSSYRGKTCGLCGNYNGNRKDDFMLPGGKQTKDLKTFTAAWKVPVPGIVCDNGCTGNVCPQCPPNKKAAFKKDCSIITNPRGPFAACHSVINPESYFRDCVYDTCVGNGDAKMFCHSIAAYMIDCQDFGITVRNWRTPSFCPLSCPANSHYEVCARSCSTSCPGLLGIISCTGQVCAEGCMCDSGFVYNGTGCVKAQQCSCFENGRTYKIGQSVITNNCQERLTCLASGQVMHESMACGADEICEIRNGVRGCYQKISKATCNIYGDPHYNTFDSVTYDFQGTCTYTAAEGCHLEGTKLNPFTVTVENEKWNEIQMSPNVSMAKVVIVEVYGMVLVLQRNMLNQIMVNGILTNIPLSLNGGKVIIQQEGCQNVILTDFGLRVAYDMVYHVSITVPSNYRGKTCGLCGNYNGNRNDDFMLPGGKQAKDLKTFTAAWKVAVPGIVCDDGCTGDVCPGGCPANKKAAFEKDCSIITNPHGPFAACHSVINPESYFRDCVYDVCMGNGDAKMFCHSIAAYMIACQDFHVPIKQWRTPTFCPLPCPANSHYAVCAQSCSAPCPGLSGIISCTGQVCAEGCMCDSGFIYNGTGCVQANRCGCYKNGQTYKIGESLITQDCREHWTCLNTGVVKIDQMRCKSDEICTVKNGVRGCYPRQCMVKSGGFFNLFNGTIWNVPSTGAFDLVSVCPGASVGYWFRVVAEFESCNSGVLTPSAVYVFFENMLVTINSKHEIWLNGKKLTWPTVKRNQIFIKVIQETVIIERSAFKLSYNLRNEITVTVNEVIADKLCGACGSFTESISAASITAYMNNYRARDFPSWQIKCNLCHNGIWITLSYMYEPSDESESYSEVLALDSQVVNEWDKISPSPGLSLAGPAGRQFAISFMQNYLDIRNESRHFLVEVFNPAAEVSASVTVTALGKVYKKTVNPEQGEFFQLPEEVEMLGSGKNQQTVQVESDQDILVSSLNYKIYSTGASVIYPVKEWGTEYYVFTPRSPKSRKIIPNAFKEFTITNYKDHNSVKVYLTSEVKFQGQVYPKGSNLSIDLEPFESVQIQSEEDNEQAQYNPKVGDLSGSRVIADQPVAVFTGHSCTWLFAGCDHVYEQLLPVSSWGQEFIVASIAYQKPEGKYDSVYIQASQDTLIRVNSQNGTTSPKVVKAGETYDIQIRWPDCLHITADKGIQVLYEFNGGITEEGILNDPFLLNILPTDQFSTSYTLVTQSGFTNEAVVIVRSQDLNGLTLGKNLTSKDFQWHETGEEFAWTQISYGEGSAFQQLSHPDSPFGLYSFGESRVNGYGTSAFGNKQEAQDCSSITCSEGEKCEVVDNKARCFKVHSSATPYTDFPLTETIPTNSFPSESPSPDTNPPKATTLAQADSTNTSKSAPSAAPPSGSVGTCWVMGDPHYRTFDGTYYNFMGNCTYIMAKNCQSDKEYPDFEIWAKNERLGSTGSTSVETVMITVYGITVSIVRHQTGLVIINNSFWNLPVSLYNSRVNLWLSGLSVIMETDFGLSVQYDWEQYLVIKIPGSFMGRMCGMCGNFNGKRNDDLITPSSSLAGSIPALAKSWRVPGLTEDAYCTDDCTGQCESCKGESWYDLLAARSFCGFVAILSHGPLRDCNALIDTNEFYKNCLLDYCMGKGYKNFLCRTAQTYTDACQRAGKKVYNWRRLLGCPNVQCTANSHFEACGSPCPATCENPTAPATCKVNYCVQACACNEGYIRSGNKCVPESQCGCVYIAGGMKRYLEANETFWADDTCQTLCTCNPQTKNVDCTLTSCPSGQDCKVVKNIRNCYPVSKSTCNIYGDPHYNTFDNSTYSFQGTCTYTAAEGCQLEGTQLTPFAVVVENEKWDGIQLTPNVSMAKLVIVGVYGLSLVLQRNEIHQIMINGVLNNIPVSLADGKVTVQQEGFQNVISTEFGLRVAYDMVYHVSITVPSSYRGRTCGLCGNYNGNRNDDFMLPGGKQTKDLKTFTAAWKVAVPGIVCDDGCTGDVCPQCPPNKKAAFEKDCSIITNPQGPFAACHSVINPESYFIDCVYDTCMGDGDTKMFCHSIAAYMIACQDFGITVQNWRTPSFCPLKCPANSHYEICAQSCSASCPGLTSIISCEAQVCAEGCMCDSGFFTNGTGCVKAQQCSCYENGHTYKVGYRNWERQ